MSYNSVNTLPKTTSLVQIQNIVALLGYKRNNDGLVVPNRVGNYFWYEQEDYHSYVGVELDIYRKTDGQITVTTRSRVSRSHWDLVQQNKTIKIIRDLFGGYFTTDAGRNRYEKPYAHPPLPLSSGCFLARWQFRDSLIAAELYLANRNLESPIAKDTATGFAFLDALNPRILSNNFLLPYFVAIWEEYFRATFTAVLRYSNQKESALKRVRISPDDLERINSRTQSLERVIAENLSFQRPSSIAENFQLLDKKLDIAAAFRKPYHRRKTNLYESIEGLIENRNEFVHTGRVNIDFFDKERDTAQADMKVAVNRAYKCITAHYKLVPSPYHWFEKNMMK